MADSLPLLSAALAAVILLTVERVAAGARAAQYRVERDAAQLQADSLRAELVHLARDLARIRAAGCRCHADDIVALADACDRRIDAAMGPR